MPPFPMGVTSQLEFTRQSSCWPPAAPNFPGEPWRCLSFKEKPHFGTFGELLKGCTSCPAGLDPAQSPNGFPWPGKGLLPGAGASQLLQPRGSGFSRCGPRAVTLPGTARPQSQHQWELLSRLCCGLHSGSTVTNPCHCNAQGGGCPAASRVRIPVGNAMNVSLIYFSRQPNGGFDASLLVIWHSSGMAVPRDSCSLQAREKGKTLQEAAAELWAAPSPDFQEHSWSAAVGI